MAARAIYRRYQAASYEFAVEADFSVAELIDSFLSPFRAPRDERASVPTYELVRHPDSPERYSFFMGDREVVSRAVLSATLDRLLGEVSRGAVEACSDVLAFHAGVVSRDGKALLLPAPSASGKTTLVAGLVRAGCSYLSDELAQIDPSTGEVLPFPRALAMGPRSIELFDGLAGRLPAELEEPSSPKRYVRPDDLRADSLSDGPAPVRAIAFPTYAADSLTKLEPISRGQAVISLIANSFNFVHVGASALELLASVVSGAVVYRLPFSDLAEAVEIAMSLLDDVVA
jgi:hypothetical protein